MSEEYRTEFNLTNNDCALIEVALRFFLENQSFPRESTTPGDVEKLRDLFDVAT
jgi:hypothetical protein